ncbi:hypothetical protein PCASD_23008 [Puccinia coronata f. sp. avenae]|uniref:Uncharacterized protein n=1 Tax=Puccinia coronata f. sp. avenae TaxID=200324 RepID=A0A2N5TN29_9BASI|nr:hypothetical protein PCASD_23008 [Puccinia coronata f. sp. avenae]
MAVSAINSDAAIRASFAGSCKWAWTAHGSPKTQQFLGQSLSSSLCLNVWVPAKWTPSPRVTHGPFPNPRLDTPAGLPLACLQLGSYLLLKCLRFNIQHLQNAQANTETPSYHAFLIKQSRKFANPSRN